MNKVILMGRLTRDPEVRYSQGNESTAIARYSLAVNRRFGGKEGNQEADFINIVAFGKAGEFAEKYFKKGMQVAIVGRIQTGSYTDKDGVKRYTTDVIVEEQQFAESKSSFERSSNDTVAGPAYSNDAPSNGFVPVDEADDDIPF